jgi:hypothetical protein
MPGKRKMTDTELIRTIDYLFNDASKEITETYLASTDHNGEFTDKEAVIKKMRSIARQYSRVANRLEEISN